MALVTLWWVHLLLDLACHLLASDRQSRSSPFHPAPHHPPQTTVSPWQHASVSFSVAVHGVLKHCALTVSLCSRKKKRALPCIVPTTYPSIVILLLFGIDFPDTDDDAGAKRPKLAAVPCASRSFCSSASARRFRKSERWTRPTV